MDKVLVTCCFLGLLLYYNTLNAGFVYDDSRAILSNPDVLPSTPLLNIWTNDFWGTPLASSSSHGSYRPLCMIAFRLNYFYCGLKPFCYHLTNVLLYILSIILVNRLAKSLLPSEASKLAVLFFTVHPIHTEAVAGIVGRADLLSCIFYLFSLLSYLKHIKYRNKSAMLYYHTCALGSDYNNGFRHKQNGFLKGKSFCNGLNGDKDNLKSFSVNVRLKFLFEFLVNLSVSFSNGKVKNSVHSIFGRWCSADLKNYRNHILQWVSLVLTVLFASAAMVSKETGVTVLAVCALLDLIYSRRAPSSKDSTMTRSLLVVCCSSVFLLLFRYYMMGNTAPTFATADNPTAKSNSLFARTATFLYLPVFNFSLLILPLNLSFDWSMDAVPRIQTLFDRRNLFSLIFYFSVYKLVRNSYQKMKLYNMSCSSRYEEVTSANFKTRFQKTSAASQVSFYTYCAPRLSFIAPNRHNICKTCKYVKVCPDHTSKCRTNNNNYISSINNNYSSDGYIDNNYVSKSSACVSDLSLVRVRCGCAYNHVHFRSHEGKAKWDRKFGHHQTVLVCLALTALPFLPATNLFFYVGFVVAERVLFTPSIGFCFLLAVGFDLVEKRCNCRLMQSLAYIVLIAFSAKTVHRNRDWLDEESLYKASLRINPPKAYGNLGSVLSSQGRLDEAEYALKMALKHRPNMADVHYNLGVLYQSRHQYEDAIRSYELAIQFRSSLALAHLNLGQLLGSLGRCEEAESVLTRCANLSGEGLKDIHTHEMTRISALLHLGRLHADRGRHEDAINVYKRAVREMPPYYQPQILYNLLGEALSRLGQVQAAEYWYQAALQAKPDHVPAHLTYGKLLARNKTRIPEAELWFQKAQKLAPKDPSVHQHFGQFLTERGRYSEAAYHLVKAAELAPTEYDLVVSAATALRQAGHGQKAEQMYRRAVNLKPTESSSHSNLGAMLHLNGRYEEAIASYSEALKLDPQDSTTLHNLEKLEKLISRIKT